MTFVMYFEASHLMTHVIESLFFEAFFEEVSDLENEKKEIKRKPKTSLYRSLILQSPFIYNLHPWRSKK